MHRPGIFLAFTLSPLDRGMTSPPSGSASLFIESAEAELVVPASEAVVRRQWFGPGLMSGVSANDPSSLVVYSAAGARFGLSMSWGMLLLLPMMSSMQEISARIGRATGRGFAANTRQFFPAWLLTGIVVALLFSNVVTIAADLSAMGAVTRLLIGGPGMVYVAAFGLAIAVLQVRLSYEQFARAVKWSALVVGLYIVAAIGIGVPWTSVSYHAFTPATSSRNELLLMFVALLGTTISPYMYFWQASLEAEETRIGKGACNMAGDLPRLRFDTFAGMGLSNVMGLSIIVTSALGMHYAGSAGLQTAAEAAEALRPTAGPVAHLLFSAAIIGSGIVGIPMLSGSTGFVIAEWRHWTSGINHSASQAQPFYGVIVLSIGIGILLNLFSVNVIDAQVYSGLISCIAVVPVLLTMMVLAVDRRIMGTMVLPPWLAVCGWLTTLVMAAAAVTAIAVQFAGS
jgi:Mn2+/Fe2+ NRAMP family transporter